MVISNKIFKLPLITVNINFRLVQIPDPNRPVLRGHQTVRRVLHDSNFPVQAPVGEKLVGVVARRQQTWFFTEPTQWAVFQHSAFHVKNEPQCAKFFFQYCDIVRLDFSTGVSQLKKWINAWRRYELLGHGSIGRKFEVVLRSILHMFKR